MLYRVLDTAFDGLEKSFADTKDVMRKQTDRPLPVRNDALVQLVVRKLPHETLSDPQHVRPFGNELSRSERRVSRALQPDEFSDIFEILTEHEVLAFGDDGHVAHAELEQPLAPAGVVQYVDVLVIDAFARKKLFRPETAASPRLREENEFFGDGVHEHLEWWRKT